MTVDLNRRTELYRAANSFEAQTLRLELEAHELHVFIENEELSMGVGDLPMGWTTSPRLMVPVEEYAAARQILNQILKDRANSQPSDSTDDLCLRCHAVLNADHCESCGWSYGAADESQAPSFTNGSAPDVTRPTLGMHLPLEANRVLEVWIEVAVVLCLGVLPYLADAVRFWAIAPPIAPYLIEMATHTVRTLCTWVVVIYLMRRSELTLPQWGVARWHFLDLVLGCILALAALITADVVGAIIPRDWFNQTMREQVPPLWWHFPILMLAMLANSLAEEFVTRAYLITRLSQLLKKRRYAVVVSSIAFASYHIYQGLAGPSFTFIFGLLMGTSFVLLGRVWPAVVAHTLYNVAVSLSPLIWPQYYS